jgi:8-oxo-dGTP pyrophosphatase MutT (NUDIX family)
VSAGEVERPGWLDPLVAALADPQRRDDVVAVRRGVGARQSAVLILIGDGPRGPQVLLVERAATLRSHPGQIAFPGGAVDPDDVDLADTALREAAEECGVDRAGVQVLGTLPAAHVAVSGFDVTGVLGWWRRPGPVAPVDAGEVASVLLVDVADLVEPAHRASVRHPSGYTGPAFEVAGHLVWGLTAHLLAGVLDLGGWSRPWDTGRRLAIPARYLRDRPRTNAAAQPRPPTSLQHGGPDAH